MRAVDTGRLALVNTAALNAQQKKIDQLMAELDDLQSSATVPGYQQDRAVMPALPPRRAR